MLDGLLTLAPNIMGAPLSVERVLGFAFSPLAWAIGVPWKEAPTAGSLLGDQAGPHRVLRLRRPRETAARRTISDRTRVIMTYALCGFANIASVGINVAGFGVLVPERRVEMMGMVWKAMLGGFLATCMTAAVVGAMPSVLYPR